ncbi:MAG: hypothetical protein JXR68_03275 [Bacteroidales bacterium]|nr:hypothetical protein [Bacteroidales bacterium]
MKIFLFAVFFLLVNISFSQNEYINIDIYTGKGFKINDSVFQVSESIFPNLVHSTRFIIRNNTSTDTSLILIFNNISDTIQLNASEEIYVPFQFCDNKQLDLYDTIFNKQQIFIINNQNYYLNYNLIPIAFYFDKSDNPKYCNLSIYNSTDTACYKVFCNIPYGSLRTEMGVYEILPEYDSTSNTISWRKQPYCNDPTTFMLGSNYFPGQIFMIYCYISFKNLQDELFLYDFKILINNNQVFQKWNQNEIENELISKYKNTSD